MLFKKNLFIKIDVEGMEIDVLDGGKKIIEKTFKVYPNFDISEVTSFSLYGSLQKRLSHLSNHKIKLTKIKWCRTYICNTTTISHTYGTVQFNFT